MLSWPPATTIRASPKATCCASQRNGTKTRAADLVQRPGRAFLRQPRLDMRLSRRILALTGGQHLTEDGFLDLGLVDTCTRYNGFDHRGTKVMRRDIGERAVETAHGGTARRHDYDIGHLDPLRLRPSYEVTAREARAALPMP